jgi:hypothetical protein
MRKKEARCIIFTRAISYFPFLPLWSCAGSLNEYKHVRVRLFGVFVRVRICKTKVWRWKMQRSELFRVPNPEWSGGAGNGNNNKLPMLECV